MEALVVVIGTFLFIGIFLAFGLAVMAYEELQALLILGGLILFGVMIFAVESSGG